MRAEISSAPHADTYEKLLNLAGAAQAWIETFIDCHAVEWYRFDPEWDPVAP